LSARAVHRHAAPLLAAVCLRLLADDWQLAPVVLAEQGRVALGDEIGALMGARMVVVLIGERPGLSSPDSLGAYLTWQPRIGRTDADRNCISNIRPEGLSYEVAGARISYLMNEARRRRLSGVALKDETGALGE
jgi:ethanolamine ammonia-lyase small subunit